jgi:hypothetical protein
LVEAIPRPALAHNIKQSEVGISGKGRARPPELRAETAKIRLSPTPPYPVKAILRPTNCL